MSYPGDVFYELRGLIKTLEKRIEHLEKYVEYLDKRDARRAE
jgi:hypothetical protein